MDIDFLCQECGQTFNADGNLRVMLNISMILKLTSVLSVGRKFLGKEMLKITYESTKDLWDLYGGYAIKFLELSQTKLLW